MADEVGGPLISFGHFLDVNSQVVPLGSGSLLYDLSRTSVSKNETESTTEANDVLRNGILIETSKGLEWLSLTEALTSGVGGLNLSVEDFQNVAAQLLHTQTSGGADTGESGQNSNISSDDEINKSTGTKTSTKPEQSNKGFGLGNSFQLESIEEAVEQCEEAREVFQNKIPVLPKRMTSSLTNRNILKKKTKVITSTDSSSLTFSESTGTNSDSSVHSAPPIQIKRKGGWPKGRKRKPELANRPPKAPSTGYVYYLNEKRKRSEFRNMPFPEVTKILGNEWSSLSLEKKKDYLEMAEMDKKRYREELKIYRSSDAYRSYLKRRQIKSCKTNGTEESDLDATDEIDDEDNEELYCRACNQWFTTLHNKKEHLYGKQHFQAISHNVSSSVSLDESSMDGSPLPSLRLMSNAELPSVSDAMSSFLYNVSEREREIKILQERSKALVMKNKQILKELQELKQSQVRLQRLSSRQKEEGSQFEDSLCHLWQVPTFFNTHPGPDFFLWGPSARD